MRWDICAKLWNDMKTRYCVWLLSQRIKSTVEPNVELYYSNSNNNNNNTWEISIIIEVFVLTDVVLVGSASHVIRLRPISAHSYRAPPQAISPHYCPSLALIEHCFCFQSCIPKTIVSKVGTHSTQHYQYFENRFSSKNTMNCVKIKVYTGRTQIHSRHPIKCFLLWV